MIGLAVALLTLGLLAVPVAVEAQQAAVMVPRTAFVSHSRVTQMLGSQPASPWSRAGLQKGGFPA
jgi:hypothetical protein